MAVTALPHAHENKINFLKYWAGFIFHGCCTLDVNLTVSYEITLVRLSIRPSVHVSLGFLKIGSLVFSDIVHYDSLPWDPVTDAATFLIKIYGGSNLGQVGKRWAWNFSFCDFLKFGSLVFHEMTYIDSLEQCLTSSWGKIH